MMKLLLTTLTILFCALCVGIFFWAWRTCASKINKIRTDVCDYIKDGTVDETKPLHKIRQEYYNSFESSDYTTEYASDYFSIDSLSGVYGVKLKVFSVIPNLLTSIGILGTFVGLAFSLLGFDTGDPNDPQRSEAIRRSIESLLAGMSTAFLTSVAGMITSAIFLVRERKLVNETEQDIDNLCSILDSKNHRSADQLILDSFNRRNEDGDLITPADSLTTIIENVGKMKTTLELFGTDLCDSIGNAMDTSFQERLVPIINDLATKLENPAQTVTDSLIEELSEVCNSFKDNLTDSVNQQMDDLLERFIDASNAINNIPEVIDAVNNTFLTSTDGTLKAHEQLSKSLDGQVAGLSNLSNSFAEAIEKMTASVNRIEAVNTSLAQMPASLETASMAIDFAVGNIKESNSKVVDAIDSIQNVNEETAAVVRGYSENIQTIQDGLSSIFEEINAGLVKYSETAKAGLQGMLDPFTTSISEATAKVANSIAPLNDAVDELSTFGDTVTKSLNELSAVVAPLEKSIKKLNEISSNETK